jgi:bifunctional non-homologous end joining protein LigD
LSSVHRRSVADLAHSFGGSQGTNIAPSGVMRREPLEVRKRALAAVLRSKARAGIQFNDHCDDLPAEVVFRHACKLGFEGIVSKRLGSPYRSGRSRDWLKMKNPNAPAVKREAEEDWGKERWR